MMAVIPAPEHDAQKIDEAQARSKLTRLEELLLGTGRLLVAYSGGVDSAFLAATAHRVLGAKMRAVIADSPSLARREFAEAKEFAAHIGMTLTILATDELMRPEYARNDANRCYHCKDSLFAAMEALMRQDGSTHLAYGMNADDRGDYRPGQRAAADHAVLAPLAEVGLTKAEVRWLARDAGYALWDRPAAPCLASRVEYGRTVTRELLAQVEAAEEAVRLLGFHEFRVRHHGQMARIEIAASEMEQALSMANLQKLSAAVKAVGFKYVALDCEGFRSGSLNAVLPANVLASRGKALTA